MDGLAMEALEARFASAPAEKIAALRALNLIWEKQRVFWRLTAERQWISQSQLFHIVGRIDEAGTNDRWLASPAAALRRLPCWHGLRSGTIRRRRRAV